jgi:AcrR family transcriptional regulator
MPRAGLTPERLVDAASELVDEVGIDGLTLSLLARRVGVRSASLYSHVHNLEDLRIRITLRALTEMADRAAVAVAGRSGRDALAGLARSYRDYATEHPGLYTAARRPLDPPTARGSAGPRHAELTAAVLRGYDLPESEHVHAVRLLGATIHGYVELQRAHAFDHSTPNADASWERAVDALDQLLQHWPAHPQENS